jgi:hypothetical protein
MLDIAPLGVHHHNDRYGLTIKQEDKAWLLPQCEHDQFIMEALTSLPAATSKRLRGAQCCHLFLQVTTLADITNSAGTKLSEWVTNPRYSQPSQWHATFIYPNQAKPNSTVWNDFMKLLQLAFTDGTNNKLQQPLGNWYRGQNSQAWNQVFSQADHKIYLLETEPRRTVQVYEQQYTRQSQWWHYQRLSPTLTFPIDAVPITLWRYHQHYQSSAEVTYPILQNTLTWTLTALREQVFSQHSALCASS